jgi:DNA-binding LacI/PurR family transcriptional regulator
MSAPQRLFEHIAAEIEAALGRDANYRPASMAILSDDFGASRSTLRKAVAILRRKALVRCFQGGRLQWTDAPGATPDHLSASRRLAAALREQISTGQIQSGDVLPKFSYLMRIYRVSKATVAQSLRHLARGKLIYKDGKRWKAGHESPKIGPQRSVLRQVIFFFVRNEVDWTSFFNDSFTTPFTRDFRGELERFGIRIKLVMLDSGSSEIMQSIEQVRSAVSELGDQYRGALMSDIWPKDKTLHHWLHVLSHEGKKPVVFFDSVNRADHFRRSTLSIPHFYRLFFDEPTAVHTAIDYLATRGHRQIGFPTFSSRVHQWAHLRLALARNAALERDCVIEHAVLRERFWDRMRSPSSQSRIWYLIRDIQKAVKANAQPAGAGTPSLHSLLTKGCTALVGINDRMAMQYLWWASAAGIKIPRDLSVISFDNIPEAEMQGLTSVDFGFGRLGYLAAHLFIRDIPVQCDKEGNIPGKCSIIERESVGAPRHRT